nr:hypothetical protein [Paracoccaceae bacterium]
MVQRRATGLKLQPLTRWWRTRSSRERWLMLGLAVAGVAYLLSAGLV